MKINKGLYAVLIVVCIPTGLYIARNAHSAIRDYQYQQIEQAELVSSCIEMLHDYEAGRLPMTDLPFPARVVVVVEAGVPVESLPERWQKIYAREKQVGR